MIDGKTPSELFSARRIFEYDMNGGAENGHTILMALLYVLDKMDQEYSKKISSVGDPRNWSER